MPSEKHQRRETTRVRAIEYEKVTLEAEWSMVKSSVQKNLSENKTEILTTTPLRFTMPQTEQHHYRLAANN